MKNRTKRLLALILCIVLAFSGTVSALAEELEQPSEEILIEETEEVMDTAAVEETEVIPEVTEEPTPEVILEVEEEPTPEPTEEPMELIVEEEDDLATVLEYEDADVKVTATGILPEGLTLSVTLLEEIEIKGRMLTAEDLAYAEKVNAQLDLAAYMMDEKSMKEAAYEIAGFMAYDICLVDENGFEVEPEDAVEIALEYKEAQLPECLKNGKHGELAAQIMHIEEPELSDPVVVDLTDAELMFDEVDAEELKSAQFTTDSFSIFVIAWTESGKTLEGTVLNQDGEVIEGQDILDIVLNNDGSVVTFDQMGEVADAEGKAYELNKVYVKDLLGNTTEIQRLRYDAVTETIQYSVTADQDDWVIFDEETSSVVMEYKKVLFTTTESTEEELVEVTDEEVPLTLIDLKDETTYTWEVVNRSNSGSELAIAGSKFELESEDLTTIIFGVTADDGQVQWFADEALTETVDLSELADGRYYLKETAVGAGYSLNATVWTMDLEEGKAPVVYVGKVTGEQTGEALADNCVEESEPYENEDGSKRVTVSFYYENGIAFSLPESGGAGIFGYTLIGVVLMMAGVLVLHHDRFRKIV